MYPKARLRKTATARPWISAEGFYGAANKRPLEALEGIQGDCAMPHFYFDMWEGNCFTRDVDGTALESPDAAEHQAARAANELSRENMLRGCTSDVGVQVLDEHGQQVLTVAVFTTVRRMDRARA
ncbi:hypothetical protein AA309_19705 [Microvirga vignae]|uniref:DUF6894 domain-containing protein n=1 Tax=Microvirga vignae TaxID=1225564 RepID=A0A0H1R8I0_9HYPH|nr:hypothetical protein [Microvirga vignae]KLK91483.1 hypothetical protein AA309_19705 [Microvirga vignae]